MISCGPDDAEKVILDWITDWCDLLAEGRIEEACARLDEPDNYGRRWSAGEVSAAVDETFSAETRFRRSHPDGLSFTEPRDSSGNPCANIAELSDGSGYWAEFNLPINGEFSDLTAQFRFRRARGRLLVSLQELHVL